MEFQVEMIASSVLTIPNTTKPEKPVFQFWSHAAPMNNFLPMELVNAFSVSLSLAKFVSVDVESIKNGTVLTAPAQREMPTLLTFVDLVRQDHL